MRDWYFGKDESERFGDLICKKLAGKTVSKRKDLAEEPGGLIYEANRLGIKDFFDLLKALEGLCYQGKAAEIDDSTYMVYGCDSVTSAEEPTIQDYIVDDKLQRYIHSLIAQIEILADDYGVTVLKADIEGDQFVVVVDGHSEVDVPLECIVPDFKSLDNDAEGILQVALGMATFEDISSCDDVMSSDEIVADDTWTWIDSKTVSDADGFLTEYTLYHNEATGMYVCIFGDSDLYGPEDTEPDFETESEEEAYEWFNSYTGLDDDDDWSLYDEEI